MSWDLASLLNVATAKSQMQVVKKRNDVIPTPHRSSKNTGMATAVQDAVPKSSPKMIISTSELRKIIYGLRLMLPSEGMPDYYLLTLPAAPKLDESDGIRVMMRGMNEKDILMYGRGTMPKEVQRFEASYHVLYTLLREARGKSHVELKNLEPFRADRRATIPRFPKLADAPGLLPVLRLCAPFTAKENGRYALTSILLNIQHNEIIASDGMRMIIAKSPCKLSDILHHDSFFWPAPLLSSRLSGDAESIALGNRRESLCYALGPWRGMVSAQGAFPKNYRDIIPNKCDGCWLISEPERMQMKEYLRRLIKTTPEEHKDKYAITFRLKPGLCTIQANWGEGMEATFDKCSFQGQNIECVVNAQYVLSALSIEPTSIKFRKPLDSKVAHLIDPIVFQRTPEGPGAKPDVMCLVMPIAPM